MRVMITGATGFVGGHVAATAVNAGHEVTALVRDRARFESTMNALSVAPPDCIEGDMVDPVAVARALDGADAVVHCAALVSIDRRNEAQMMTGNVEGVRNVLGIAAQRSLDPIVHVSSTSALFRPGAGPLTVDHEPAHSKMAYGASKAQCEAVARQLQADGAPVVIVYPAGILGPPAGSALGETASGVSQFVAAGLVPTRDGSLSVIDVRDLAAILVAQLEPGLGPRRIMCGGNRISMTEIAELFRQVTGRRFPALPVPAAALRGAGRLVDIAQKLLPFDSSMTHEAMSLATQWEGTIDSDPAAFGVELRDSLTTFAESLPYWRDAGLITTEQLGSPSG